MGLYVEVRRQCQGSLENVALTVQRENMRRWQTHLASVKMRHRHNVWRLTNTRIGKSGLVFSLAPYLGKTRGGGGVLPYLLSFCQFSFFFKFFKILFQNQFRFWLMFWDFPASVFEQKSVPFFWCTQWRVVCWQQHKRLRCFVCARSGGYVWTNTVYRFCLCT